MKYLTLFFFVCKQGLIATLLECFRDVMIIQDQALKGKTSLLSLPIRAQNNGRSTDNVGPK